jgi:hypothetical protein
MQRKQSMHSFYYENNLSLSEFSPHAYYLNNSVYLSLSTFLNATSHRGHSRIAADNNYIPCFKMSVVFHFILYLILLQSTTNRSLFPK